jgi:hypothetical protein
MDVIGMENIGMILIEKRNILISTNHSRSMASLLKKSIAALSITALSTLVYSCSDIHCKKTGIIAQENSEVYAPTAFERMLELSPLLGDWRTTVSFYYAPKQQLLEHTSDISCSITPMADKSIYMLKMTGTLHGQEYEGAEILYYDTHLRKYVQVLCDNIMSRPLTAIGDSVQSRPHSQYLETIAEDGSEIQAIELFGKDSVFFSCITNDSARQELSRLTLRKK